MFKLNEKLESVWSNNRQNPRGWPTNGIVIDYRIKAIKGFWPETATLTLYKNTILKQKQTQTAVLCLQCDLHFVRSTVFKSLPLECMGQIWRQRRLTSCRINNFHFYSTFQTSIRGTKRERKRRLALTTHSTNILRPCSTARLIID